MSIALELVAVGFLILLNGFFSMSEMAVVSARKPRIKKKADEGSYRYRLVLKTAEHPTRFLSTIQIAITLIGTLSGAIGGATLADALDDGLSQVEGLAPYAEAIALAIVVVAITFFSVVFGELIPKRLALHSPEKVSGGIIVPVRVLSAIFYPLVFLFSATTELVLKIFRLKDSKEPSVTEEEIHIMMQQGAEEGVFEPSERHMVQEVLDLGSQRLDSYMTHRTDIVAIDVTTPVATLLALIMEHPEFSQFPVCRDNLDHVEGIIIAKEALIRAQRGNLRSIGEVIRKPTFLPASMDTLKALSVLRATTLNAAFVIDEYGGVSGLVSLTDITDAIFGALTGKDHVNNGPTVRDQGAGTYEVDGMMDIDDFASAVDFDLPKAEYAQTVAGLAIEVFGRMPEVGDMVISNGLAIKVLEMDGKRIEKLLFISAPSAGPKQEK